MELAVFLTHLFVLIYPDSITEQQTRDYELAHAKQFVPLKFIGDIPLFGQASVVLKEGLDMIWSEHVAVSFRELPRIQLVDRSDVIEDPDKRSAALTLFQYAQERHRFV